MILLQQESRKDEFLEISKLKIDSLKRQIKESEKELVELEKEAINIKLNSSVNFLNFHLTNK